MLLSLSQRAGGLALIERFRSVVYKQRFNGKLFTLYSGWAFRYKTLSDNMRQTLNFLLPGNFSSAWALLAVTLARERAKVLLITFENLQRFLTLRGAGAVVQFSNCQAAFMSDLFKVAPISRVG